MYRVPSTRYLTFVVLHEFFFNSNAYAILAYQITLFSFEMNNNIILNIPTFMKIYIENAVCCDYRRFTIFFFFKSIHSNRCPSYNV